ncbi:MAG: prepilin-type N-terminal cleavage/methylation domain-containing protein [Candidatus Gracilibacteria bacterium]
MKFSARLRKGFTLIELLIVIVIIGILAVGLVPKVIDAPKKARDTVRKTDVNQIKIAAESYYTDNSKYPADLAAMASYFQGGIAPVNAGGLTNYSFTPLSTSTCYYITATLESAAGGNELTAQAPADCPALKTLMGDAAKVAPGLGKYYIVAGGSF